MSVDPFTSASDLVGKLAGGEVTSAEVAELYLERAGRFNPALNAICVDTAGGTRERAAAADAGGRPGRLHGLPLTLKESCQVAGLPWTAGINGLRETVASEDGPVPARMFAAGGVLLGKTNIPPFLSDWQADNAIYGRTVNPWDASRSPGGSTGGGAAAVAAGLSPLEIGSDIGGSIRVPAAFCGIFGHRPSDSAVPRSGSFPPVSVPIPAAVMGVQGPLARSAADLELALEIIAGPEPGEEGWRLELPPARHERFAGMRVAMFPPAPFVPFVREVGEALERVAKVAAAGGAKVGQAAPEGFDWRAHHKTYVSLLNNFIFADLPEAEREKLATDLRASDDEFREAKLSGLTARAGDFLMLLRAREQCRRAWAAFFRNWDVAVAPITIVPAFKHDQSPFPFRRLDVDGQTVRYDLQVVYPGLATLPGLPATAFPCGRDRDGLPIGLQVVGPNLEDRTTIRFAEMLEREGFAFSAPPGYA